MSRLVFTVATGKPKYGEMALGLGRSLKLIGDTNPRAIYTDIDGPWERYFDLVIRPTEKRSALDKMRALELTQANEILSIDCDCLVFRRLDEVFEYCRGRPYVVQGDEQTNGTWHGANVQEVCSNLGRTSIPRFNGGFIYYERNPDTEHLITEMRQIERNYGQTGFENFRGNASEEVCVSLAMMRTGIGEVIPDDTDFMSTGVGLIGKLHIDIRKGECSFLCRRAKARFIRPHIFHASRYSNFLIYWRQLKWLREMGV